MQRMAIVFLGFWVFESQSYLIKQCTGNTNNTACVPNGLLTVTGCFEVLLSQRHCSDAKEFVRLLYTLADLMVMTKENASEEVSDEAQGFCTTYVWHKLLLVAIMTK